MQPLTKHRKAGARYCILFDMQIPLRGATVSATRRRLPVDPRSLPWMPVERQPFRLTASKPWTVYNADQAMQWFAARRGGTYELEFHRSLSFGYRYEPADGPALFARVVGPEPHIRDRVFHDYRLAKYLYRHGIPVAEPMGFPLLVNGGYISQARYVELEKYDEYDAASRGVSLDQFGASLAAIHQVEVPPNAQLPRHNPTQQLARMLERITAHDTGCVSSEELHVLSHRIRQADGLYQDRLALVDQPHIVHGDASLGNFCERAGGRGVMPTDFEYGGVGIPAYDLAQEAWACQRNPLYRSIEQFDGLLAVYRQAGGEVRSEDIDALIPLHDTFRAVACLGRSVRDPQYKQLWADRFTFYMQLFRGEPVGELEPGHG